MRIAVPEAVAQLDRRGLIERRQDDHSDRIIEHVGDLVGRAIPGDLADFYRERIHGLDGFLAIRPTWNDHVGWHGSDSIVARLLHVQAAPIFWDGCGSLYGLDLASGEDVPAVYFFDHEDSFERPRFAAGSSLGAFLLLLADHDRASEERWPPKWELTIDPDLEKCPRAPAIWDAG